MNSGRTLRPSKKLLVKYNLGVGLVFITCILPFVFLGFIPRLGWTYVWVFLIANVLWLVPTYALLPAYYRSIEYELAPEEIVVRVGIVTKTVKTVPYRTVTNIEVKRGFLDRLLGIGGIAIHTAGYSAQGGPEIRLSGLEDCDGAHSEILAALRRYRSGTGAAIGAEEVPVPEQQVLQLLAQILEELRALRRSLGSRD
ncbi:MAG TPA: PH domain-containing protein [Anaerolineae bacterium]|nr:PH domain-containing protein [Anaerolineae bacterium]